MILTFFLNLPFLWSFFGALWGTITAVPLHSKMLNSFYGDTSSNLPSDPSDSKIQRCYEATVTYPISVGYLKSSELLRHASLMDGIFRLRDFSDECLLFCLFYIFCRQGSAMDFYNSTK